MDLDWWAHATTALTGLIAPWAGLVLLRRLQALNAVVTAAMLTGVQSIEQMRFNGGGTNSLTLSASFMNTVSGGFLTVTGGAGSDSVDATALTNSAQRLQVNTGAGNDTVLGGQAAEQVFVAGADFSGSDTFSGGTGANSDRLSFLSAVSANAAAFAGVSQVEIIDLAAGTNSIELTNAMGTSARNNQIIVNGGNGNDTVNASAFTAPNNLFVTAGAGNDVLAGGAGADFFQLNAAELTGADTITGNAGSDTLRFTSAGTVGAAAFAGVSGIDTVRLHTSGTSSVTLADAMAIGAAGNTVSVLGFGGNDAVNASAFTASHRAFFNTGAGNDTLTGGAGNDNFSFLTGDLTAADTVAGGGGVDLLAFQNGGTITAANLAGVSGVENITLANSTNTLTLADALVSSAAGSVTVNGGTGNDTVNASSLTGANRVIVIAGDGNDNLTGGAGADQFRFAAASYSAADTVDGNGGNDTLLFTTAGTIAGTAFAGTREVETILLANGTNSLTLTDVLVGTASGTLLTIGGGTGNDTVNGAGVTTAANRISVTGGTGDDTLVGGAGNDTLNGGVNDDTLTGRGGTDALTGGADNDVFVYQATSDSNQVAGMDTIADMGSTDRLDLSALALATDKTAILNRGSAAYLGTTVDFFNDAGTDRAVAVQTSGGTTRVYADSNGDGDYTLGTDLAIQLTGNVLANLTSTSDYIF
jgi:Ca2+-binding RTX toxin-like protein